MHSAMHKLRQNVNYQNRSLQIV